ncbi:hypothetical protein Pmar_PMAR001786 [Perkinsus marinus ATCC 50983]|uniref:Uncharacterized protein n=1 Tax=Perkinsus marinus (strain ATCC 50983 / TXsc) TaxID=423536 RepID=C5LJM4_PERM5|nr:hypothetical protein Pmar_PMAR001786 [Perkinsus marinus ATCC 50983]EER03041.1 hypothetical protein Pmar_PMAR001786 [Perkinsus marinus ATCC 50983]|eukprot:XP_002771225.1 hypothetical protein Pmar_PMAR001786 [Perkinsus marinus ATCC 50983]
MTEICVMNDMTRTVVKLHCAFKLGGDSTDEEIPEDRFIEAAVGAACKRFLGEIGSKRLEWSIGSVSATPESAAGDFVVCIEVREAGRKRTKSRSNRSTERLRPHQLLWASLTALRSMASRPCRVCVVKVEEGDAQAMEGGAPSGGLMMID